MPYHEGVGFDMDCQCMGTFREYSVATRAWHHTLLDQIDHEFLSEERTRQQDESVQPQRHRPGARFSRMAVAAQLPCAIQVTAIGAGARPGSSASVRLQVSS